MKVDALAGNEGGRNLLPDTRTANEARMQAILQAAVDGIISIDQRGFIQTVNPAAERLFGYVADELIGQNVTVLMPSPYQEEHDAYIARYLATGEKRIIGIGREVVGQRKDGTTFPMDLSVAEARLGDERIPGGCGGTPASPSMPTGCGGTPASPSILFVGIIRDITERKRAEEAIQESKQHLEKVVAELEAKNEEIRTMAQQLWLSAKLASVGELAASIAHELNNPLATVSLRVESLLNRTPAESPSRRALEVVAQETKRMGDLVANLLQFSRRGQEQISTVDLCQELTRAVELVYYHLRKRRITVVQEFAADTPTLYADRQKLRQVFLNLLTNASDAMPEGGTLTLRTAASTLEGGKPAVQIDFQDTGVGIAAEHLDQVLAPFFTTKEEGKGTGLGLAICRRVVQEHHGTLEVQSQVGQGTTIHIVLPVKDGTNVNRLRGAGTQGGN
jgi:PAS domain S-box-containing protein